MLWHVRRYSQISFDFTLDDDVTIILFFHDVVFDDDAACSSTWNLQRGTLMVLFACVLALFTIRQVRLVTLTHIIT
jgi:hypothetical protein